MDFALTKPLTVALVDDYDMVLIGLAHLFDDHRDRVAVAEIDANATLEDRIDVDQESEILTLIT